MNSVSKVKIAVGYTLLLAVLFFSLFFVHREMENLILTDDRDVQWTDSVLALIREKDTNTIRMLRTLSEANDSMVSTSDIEQIIAQQDSVVTQQRVQHRIITHRDTVVTRPRKKGFFRRLGEVFVPPKKDTAIQVKTSLEFATDTVIEPYNPADSLHEKLRAVAQPPHHDNTEAEGSGLHSHLHTDRPAQSIEFPEHRCRPSQPHKSESITDKTATTKHGSGAVEYCLCTSRSGRRMVYR
jgi:hypothetical protein